MRGPNSGLVGRSVALLALISLAACSGGTSSSSDEEGRVFPATAETCMACHNGAKHDDYSGAGLENPHPFPGAATLTCSECHGGNPRGTTPLAAHVPPPPEIGDENFQEDNALAYFNRLTLTGIDQFPDYEVEGTTYSAIDYLQFVNPGDLRVVSQDRSCGQCHEGHVDCVMKSPLATSAGIFSGAMFGIGARNHLAENRGLYEQTAGDLAFRATEDEAYIPNSNNIGAVGFVREFPVYSQRNKEGERHIFENDAYLADELTDDIQADGRVVSDSPLAHLYHEQVAFTCGDCHLGSAGANNRYGDYRSSGCTACHMRYSSSGRSFSTDPNIKKFEPLDVDDIDEPERPHVHRHRIVSVAKTLANGEFNPGMDDYTCAGCHQGSNRTVMQFWGIRLDQNQDVRRGHQYPADPFDFETTREDTRLFDPEIENNTFNGRNANQYLLFEDYDGDGRDDTPADVHYEAGMGCIDCHGSHDLHGGTPGVEGQPLVSRQEQAVAIRCESCHGSADEYASTVAGTTYAGDNADLALDAEGNPMRHVTLDNDGHYYLTSRLTGKRHYVRQVKDIIVDSGREHPFTGEPLFSSKGSYAMGRADGDDATGIGPQQDGVNPHSFSHLDSMSCVSCHASWTNNCIGCHLEGEYNNGNNFSNITGRRIVFNEENAQFIYQSPVMFQLGVDTHDKIAPIAGNTDMFFRWFDRENQVSETFAFSDRRAQGANKARAAFPSLAHNVMMPHSIRGKVTNKNEGVRYCVSCHLTDNSVGNWRAEYDQFRSDLQAGNYGALDFELLKQHIGQNPGNQLDSPFWVHGVSGLGTGLFLFDEDGCPTNPLDDNEDRFGCNDVAPADNFDPGRGVYDLDRIVTEDGRSTASNNHALLKGEASTLRDGSLNPEMSGPLGRRILELLADPDQGLILDSWINADGKLRGNARDYLND